MIQRLIGLSGDHPRLVVVITILLALWGGYCLQQVRIDALPDLSPTQVIIFTEWMGRGPDLMEDQVTYPLVSTMLSAPRVKVVRGFSMFGMSFVYVIFADGTDIYWARSRVMEYLSQVRGQLPDGVTPTIGPDATGVGWVLQYALVDRDGTHDLASLRSFQDWYLRYWLASVPGVAEIAGIGGFQKQYQVEVDPNRLSALNITIEQVIRTIRGSSQDAGGRTVEIAGREHYVVSLGYVQDPAELAGAAIGTNLDGTPIRISDVGRVVTGPELRRGLADLDGRGDTVGGVVVMRQGEDASRVIAAVKQRIEEVQGAFPPGVELQIVYDRSDVIREAVGTLRKALIEESIIIALVILVFLLHVRSVLLAAIVLPLSFLVSFIPVYYLGIGINIMSLGGLILAAGDIVDAVLVIIESAHKKLARPGETRARKAVILEACSEAGPPMFSALLVIAVSFLPIFALEAEEGRLFHPLAYTKTFAMLAAALISVTVVPVLAIWLLRGRIRTEQQNPVHRLLSRGYRPVVASALRHPVPVLGSVLLLTLAAAWLFTRLGSEFMPDLWEGSLLYMPVTDPGISVTTAADSLTRQGAALRAVPEVASVFGKAGRYETATDPAPLSMFEFTIQLRPKAEWRPGITEERLVELLDEAVAIPGLNRAWTRPVRGRIDMLTTGIRTPVGLKVFGPDLVEIERIGRALEAVLQDVRGTHSVYAERTTGGYYVRYQADRARIARHGLTLADVQAVIETAIGGMTVTQTIEGRERYSISVRYPRELRDNLAMLNRVLIATPTGAQVPLGELGEFVQVAGPPMIVNEDGSLAGFVYVDIRDRDVGSYVDDARRAVGERVELPPGYRIEWTGQYEYLERVRARLQLVVPLTLVLVFAVLYIGIQSTPKVLLVMTAVPLSLIGGIFLMWVLDYNTSVAVWAGAIALIGVAVETCAIMLFFLDQAWREARDTGQLGSTTGVHAATLNGAMQSFRPVLMAVATNALGLIPIMVAVGIGADVMKRIASPMFGGLVSLILLTLVVIPVLYQLLESRRQRRQLA